MSVAASRYIRHVLDGREDLSSTARHLLEVLGHLANADGISYWSVPELARRMGYVGRNGEPVKMTVRRARRELTDAGLILFVEGRGRKNTNLYALPIRDHWCSLCDDEKGTPTREKGTPTRAKGNTGEPRSIHEGSIEGPPVTISNGFAIDGDSRPIDHSSVDDIISAIRDRRYHDIPDPNER